MPVLVPPKKISIGAKSKTEKKIEKKSRKSISQKRSEMASVGTKCPNNRSRHTLGTPEAISYLF